MTAEATIETIIDVTDDDFYQQVIQRSHEVPVVVDFWASWCGPCRTLGPILEEAVSGRDGEVVLAKVDVDANQQVAAHYQVRGIPAVKGFRDGDEVAAFTGAQPAAKVEAFLDRVVPSEADRAVSLGRRLHGQGDIGGARDAFEEALDLDETHREAALALADLNVENDPDRAMELVRPLRPDPEAEKIVTRAELARTSDDLDTLRQQADQDPTDMQARVELGRALAAAGMHRDAVEELLAVVESNHDTTDEAREAAREQLVALFPLIGQESPVVTRARKRLAAALY